MAVLICKLEGKYFLWSTEGDAPCSPPWTLDELKSWYEAEFGRAGMRELPDRIARADSQGVSVVVGAVGDVTFETFSECNRAWKGEATASFEQFKAWARGEGSIFYLGREVR